MLHESKFTAINHGLYSLEQVTIWVLYYITHFKGYLLNHKRAFKCNMSDIQNVSFDFSSKLDAVEVLQIVLDNLKNTCVLASDNLTYSPSQQLFNY